MSTEKTEYEREPVPEKAQLGFKSFVGQYAGEHTAGTELMIGPLFVAAGVSAFDLVMGLLIGNLLAVLSWTLMTAPIATRVRLTLYYQLEKITGRRFVVIYLSSVVVTALAIGWLFDLVLRRFDVSIVPALAGGHADQVSWIGLGSAVVLGLLLIWSASRGSWRAAIRDLARDLGSWRQLVGG